METSDLEIGQGGSADSVGAAVCCTLETHISKSSNTIEVKVVSVSFWKAPNIKLEIYVWLDNTEKVHTNTHTNVKYSLGQRHTTSLANQLLMVQHWRVPLQLQEVKQFPHFVLSVEYKLLIADRQTSGLPSCLALAEHGLHCTAPLSQAVPVAG